MLTLCLHSSQKLQKESFVDGWMRVLWTHSKQVEDIPRIIVWISHSMVLFLNNTDETGKDKITGQILVLVYWKRQTLWSCLHGWIVDILGFKTSGKNIRKTSVRWITCCVFTNCLGNRQKILYSLFSVSLLKICFR